MRPNTPHHELEALACMPVCINLAHRQIYVPDRTACGATDRMLIALAGSTFVQRATGPGYDSPGVAPRGACPPPVIMHALPGPPRHFQKCSSTLYCFHIAFMGRHPPSPGPGAGEPSQFLRACCTLHRTVFHKVPAMLPCLALVGVYNNICLCYMFRDAMHEADGLLVVQQCPGGTITHECTEA